MVRRNWAEERWPQQMILMRKRLLDIGAERFYTDSHFLRELFIQLEIRDAAGAAGVVNQLITVPSDLEPIYLGQTYC